MSNLPYNDLNTYLRTRFGCKVHKITIDAGLTCPNRDGTVGYGGCIYCNERGSGTGASAKASISKQITLCYRFSENGMMRRNSLPIFNRFPIPMLRWKSSVPCMREALSVEDIIGLTIGTRPDCIDDEVLALLEELNRKTYISVEYGLQSIHDRTLELINRGHTADMFRDAVARTRARGIEVCTHVILGLPGETKRDMLDTARAVGEMDIQAIKIHLMYVVRGTKLHEMYENGEYECLTREDYIDILCDFLALLPPDMVIHRLTGDPHRDELIAPLWALEKNTNINTIRDALESRKIRQGMLYK